MCPSLLWPDAAAWQEHAKLHFIIYNKQSWLHCILPGIWHAACIVAACTLILHPGVVAVLV